MKGIEEMPFRILISLVILALVIGASFGFLSSFVSSKAESDFKKDVLGIWQSMATLASAGDPGSFRTVLLNIPHCCSMNISIDSDIMTGITGSGTFSLKAAGNITQVVTTTVAQNGTVSFGPGKYELQLFYGNPSVFTNWTIVFR
ncbi:MAG: hypothetical protein QW548_00775 [Candidatus Aenigmatarchaeota archaeon]